MNDTAEGAFGMAQAAVLWGAAIYVLENTSARPVSRYREMVAASRNLIFY